MRGITFGTYDTAAQQWTLASWSLSPAVYKANLVQVPASDLVLDLSTALTDGEARYSPRTLTVTLETSVGDRLARKGRIDQAINQLSGKSVNIILPDDNAHYLTGRLNLQEMYNTPAHASLLITATCDPWMYSAEETVYTLTAAAEQQEATVSNDGRRSVVPTVTVADGSVHIGYGASSWDLSEGTYQIPDLYITPGNHTVTYSGTGTITIRYRKAVLS